MEKRVVPSKLFCHFLFCSSLCQIPTKFFTRSSKFDFVFMYITNDREFHYLEVSQMRITFNARDEIWIFMKIQLNVAESSLMSQFHIKVLKDIAVVFRSPTEKCILWIPFQRLNLWFNLVQSIRFGQLQKYLLFHWFEKWNNWCIMLVYIPILTVAVKRRWYIICSL